MHGYLRALLAALALASGAAHAEDKAFTRADATDAIATMRKIVTDNGVERLEKVNLGGLDQWISIRGQDKDNPVLLFLHGGPGFATMPMSWRFQTGWEDYFTVVQWDQRGAGKTYAEHDPAAVAPTMTIDQFVTDAEDLIRRLQNEFGKEKIFVAGISWGSIVGIEVAQRHPEWLHAYVGLGQLVDFRENEKRGWDFVMNEAKRRGDEDAIAKLEAIAPYPNDNTSADDLFTQRGYIGAYGGAMHNRSGYGSEAAGAVLSPEYTDADMEAFRKGPEYAFRLIFPELMAFSVLDLRRLECPIVLFSGRYDYNVNSDLGAEWLARLKAPAKEIVWFEHSAHLTMSEEPGRALVALVETVRPFAEKAGDVPAAERRAGR